MCYRQICRVLLSVFVVLCISGSSGGNGFVCAYVVCALFAAGYAFDFGGDPRLVEACCGEFAGDVLFV